MGQVTPTTGDTRPILFMDIDGVLNTHDMPLGRLKPECIDELNRIVETTGCKVVLSSSWRYIILNGDMTCLGFEYMLRTHGSRLNRHIIGTTAKDPDDTMDHRGGLVSDWLREALPSRQEKVYAILDDSDYALSNFGWRFVQTDDRVGLTAADADRVIEILTGKVSQ